ncbi:hypothetical protein QWA68_006758, partial [Fusarium oxysporum]
RKMGLYFEEVECGGYSKEVMEEFELPRQSGLIGVYREQEQDIDINAWGQNRPRGGCRYALQRDHSKYAAQRAVGNCTLYAMPCCTYGTLDGEPGRWAPGARCKVKIDRDQTKDDV